MFIRVDPLAAQAALLVPNESRDGSGLGWANMPPVPPAGSKIMAMRWQSPRGSCSEAAAPGTIMFRGALVQEQGT
jgi:hypothetical protein